ncbi:hypothetical protein D7D52_26560 [Nocardia yunnanensis]|uniref:Mce-associated membrane protein n=1 Tax=Nocardia yunnanensis TaxID=2382165 RepID=A0A386ZJL8_9NOCA|nr:hypothetical protein [Nocardia yunnanensis]AYF76785.1 hypothetical protein D7D52_26560 [Nocardia yunnanensis]
MTNEQDSAPASTSRTARSVAIPLSTMVWSAAVAVLVIALVTAVGFLIAARGELSDRDSTAKANTHAEQVAGDYAVGAATVNFADFNAWVGKLKANTSPALAAKFDTTAPKLQDILTPLKWTSTATPITAKVMSESGGVYKVNVFVNVTSTNAQNPDGAQTTVTYNVTVDRNADWKITDVGGMDGALPLK